MVARTVRWDRRQSEIAMSMGSEFSTIARGNVVDMAVGVIIGGAFGKIVTSQKSGRHAADLRVLTGGIDFAR